MSFLYSGSLWSSLYCGVSSLCVGLYRCLVKVSWLGKLVSMFWWMELYFFSLECNEMSSNELWDVYGFGVTSTFTFIKRLFSSSLSAIRVESSAYLRLLIFLSAILIPACASCSPAFLMMYSAYKLNKQGDNIQPWHTPFPIWNQSVVPCLVLTVASWPAYRFLKRQIRWSSIPISFRISSVYCGPHSKGFGIVNKTEIDVFLELSSCFFDDPADVGTLISDSSAFSKPA